MAASVSINPTASVGRTWLRRLAWFVVCIFLFLVLPSFQSVRSILILPLYRHEAEARGDVAYVMADGPAYYERLRTASDLYHMRKVGKIFLSEENTSAGYHFTLKRSITRVEKAQKFLELWGVPSEIVETIPIEESALLGSASEADNFAANSPPNSSVVVVTSAPHTRRSLLCFQRALKGSGRQVAIYSASEPYHSAELSAPIWLEYLKLAIYWVAV